MTVNHTALSSRRLSVMMPKEILNYIVEKGSIAMSGISLTVADVDDTSFKVSIIPHTLEVTALGQKDVGDAVNLECDMVGKYIEKWCDRMLTGDENNQKDSGLSLEFLKKYGF